MKIGLFFKNKPRLLLLIFQVLSFSLLFLNGEKSWDNKLIYMTVGFIAVTFFFNFFITKLLKIDEYIIIIAGMLLSIGLLVIFRISMSHGIKQLMWIFISYVAFLIAYAAFRRVPNFKKLRNVFIAAGYIFFILTIALGVRHQGSINWISIGGKFTIQLSEFTKLLLILILATYYGTEKNEQSFKGSLVTMGIVYSYIGLLFVQRDLGSVLIFTGIYTAILIAFEEDKRVILLNLGLLIIGAIAGCLMFNHVRIRLKIWKDPWQYANNEGYQIIQSLFGLAEGGFFGKGIGLGNPEYIIYVIYDFIFAAIVEEMGIFAGIAIIMLYMLFVYRGMKLALNQKHPVLKVVAVGISALFAGQCFVAIGGVIKLIPLTGITLPLMSYGGSSMLSSFIALAMLEGCGHYIGYGDETDER